MQYDLDEITRRYIIKKGFVKCIKVIKNENEIKYSEFNKEIKTTEDLIKSLMKLNYFAINEIDSVLFVSPNQNYQDLKIIDKWIKENFNINYKSN